MKSKFRAFQSQYLRAAMMGSFAVVLVGCGGGSDSSPTPVENPDRIDVNGDGVVDENDFDYNGDGVITQQDAVDYAADNPPIDNNPQNIDVNGDGFVDFNDTDYNGDGVIDQQDADDYAADNQPEEGNLDPKCDTRDCDSSTFVWLDNAQIGQNQSPKSSYATGIQRILFCLNYGGTEDGATINGYSDGIYGPNTAASVKAYQSDKGIASDGIVGRDTWERLQAELTQMTGISDGVYQYYEIISNKVGCDGVAQFAHTIAEPRIWQLIRDPGDPSLALVPFTYRDEDRPNF